MTEGENKKKHQITWKNLLLTIGITILLYFDVLLGATWRTSITARKPDFEMVKRDSLNHVSIATTDYVNVYRDFNAFDARIPDVISFGLIGVVDHHQMYHYGMYVYMMVRANHIIKISQSDRLALELSNGAVICLKAEEGQIQTTPGRRRRSLPTTEQTVLFEIEESLLDSVCSYQIVRMSFFNADDSCTVMAREGATQKIQERYIFLKDFLKTEGKQWEETVLIESTKTKDPNIVRFAKMTPVLLDDHTSVKIKGYIDKDGNKGFVWDLYFKQNEKTMPPVKANSNVTLYLCNGQTLKTYVYSDGYIRKQKSTGECMQLVACRITARQMKAISQGCLSDLEIQTPQNPYRVIVPADAAYELAKRCRVLQRYLDGTP